MASEQIPKDAKVLRGLPTTNKDKGPLPCSDPSVVVSKDAPEKTKKLWQFHGHPHAERYSDPKLVSLVSLLKYNAATFCGETAFLYPVDNQKDTPYNSISWDQFYLMTDRLAWRYAQCLRDELLVAKKNETQPTIALLGVAISLQYFVTQIALLKLNVRLLLLADKNSKEAIKSLISRSNATVLITDTQKAARDIEGIRKFSMLEDYLDYNDSGLPDIRSLQYEDERDSWERHTYIMHSSGSTGPPKLIVHTNRSMMLCARMYRLFPDFHIENWFLLSPLLLRRGQFDFLTFSVRSHIAGICVILSGLPNGLVCSFPPLSWPPSASSLLAAWKTLATMGHPVDDVHCAPTIIENLHEHIINSGGDFSPLSSLLVLMPMGAKLSDSIVESLVSHNVNVKTTYGSTETGPVLRTIPHTKDNPSCYKFRNLYPDNDKIQMEEVGEGLYECIIYKGFGLAAELWDSKSNNEPYRTNDLFLQDPPGSGYYFLQGRRDDVLVHSNGSMTSAGALQLDVEAASPIINKVLAVGQSKICVCLLIEVVEGTDRKSNKTLRRVWQAVEGVNPKYPQHSRVLQNMMYIIPEGISLPVTPKGNVKRNEALKMFAKEIDTLYLGLESDQSIKVLTDEEVSLSTYLLKAISTLARVPRAEIQETTDFYAIGIDSVAALQLRKALSSRVGPVSLGAIFEHPSVEKLVSFLGTKEKSIDEDTHISFIHRVIEKYSSDFLDWPASDRSPVERKHQEVILLTGASGSLGTALLEALLAAPTVSKIYALIRGPNTQKKLEKSLALRGLDAESILANGKIKILKYSMTDPLLGLDVDTYHHLSKVVTIVLHNAWRVDFNQVVECFEKDCLRGTMSLLRFCQAGNPKVFAFTSSVSTCLGDGATADNIPESPIGNDPSMAMRTGYAQSKYIVERLTQLASIELGTTTRVFRVGQLCGHSVSGYWSEQEMFPIMFATSKYLNAIPVFHEKPVEWIPVDVAAGIITDILTQMTADTYSVHNIINPHPVSWSTLVSMLKKSEASSQNFGSDEISIQEWVSRLNKLASEKRETRQVPGLKLLQFFEDMASHKEVARRFDTEKTASISTTLRECPEVCQDWIDSYVTHWKRSGFLQV